MTLHSAKHDAKLDTLRIATPCPISWDQMTGDNQVRFCGHCQLNVYNIAELSRTEAERLIASTEGRLCARLYRRADGTILTKDCPVGLRALRMRVSKRAAAVFAAIVSLAATAFGQQSAKDDKTACTPQTRITRIDAASDHKASGLSGTVVDPSGAAIPGATVTVTNDETKETRSTFTNAAGRFEFGSIAPGSYSVTIETRNFKTLQVLNVVVETGKVVNLDTIAELSDGYLTGVVDVSFQVDSPPPGTTIIGADIIRRLPIQ